MNNYSLLSDAPKTVTITRIKDEAQDFKTFYFRYEKECKPGQFLMVWLPRIDEKPFTISYISSKEIGITVQKRGNFTAELFKLKVGDKFGIRGPYGKGFNYREGTSCIIAGGSGAAAIMPLIDMLDNPIVIIGSRSINQLLYTSDISSAHFTTDDGSYGIHGNVLEVLLNIMKDKKIDNIYTCGPEIMMKNIIDVCKKNGIYCQFALERYMKCGVGVCGQCTCGKKRVCADGPVFSIEDLNELSEFGVSHRDKTGNAIKL